MHYIVFVLFCFVWCPCMAINVVRVQYNCGLLPDIILLTQCYYHRRGTRLNAMKKFCLCRILSHLLNILTFSPRTGGSSGGPDAFIFSLNTTSDRSQAQEQCSVRSVVRDPHDFS